MRFSDIIFPLSFAIATVSAGVVNRSADSTLQDGRDAQRLNQQFQGLTVSSKCLIGETICVNGRLSQCVGDKFVQVASFTTPHDAKALIRSTEIDREVEGPIIIERAAGGPTCEVSVETPADMTKDTSPIRREDDGAALQWTKGTTLIGEGNSGAGHKFAQVASSTYATPQEVEALIRSTEIDHTHLTAPVILERAAAGLTCEASVDTSGDTTKDTTDTSPIRRDVDGGAALQWTEGTAPIGRGRSIGYPDADITGFNFLSRQSKDTASVGEAPIGEGNSGVANIAGIAPIS